MTRLPMLLALSLLVSLLCTQASGLDSTLVACLLTPAQEVELDLSDSAIAPFWNRDWEGRDSIVLTVPENCYPEYCDFDGPDDAAVVVKAATTAEGVYVYARVTDDVWMMPESDEHYEASTTDILNLYIDQLGSYAIASCRDCLIGLYNSSLSYYHRHLRLQAGGPMGSLGVFLGYKDPNIWSYTWSVALSPADAWERFQMRFEGVESAPQTREFECMLTWHAYDLAQGLCPGERLALSVTYHDRDALADSASRLSWMGRDPWAPDAQEMGYWGDLVVGDGQECTPATLSILKPNGGEQLLADVDSELAWEYTGAMEYVAIDYSLDGGQTWTRKNPGYGNNGSYPFSLDTVSDQVLIRVSDASDGIPADTSDAVFSLVRELGVADNLVMAAGRTPTQAGGTVSYDLRGRLLTRRAAELSTSVVIERRKRGMGTVRRVWVGR